MRNSTPEDLLERLAVDPGKRTLGELLQERESARLEILDLRQRLSTLTRDVAERRSAPPSPAPPVKQTSVTLPARVTVEQPAVAPAGRMLRLRDVEVMVGVKRSTIYKWISRGRFPRQVRLGEHAVAWHLSDILAWQEKLGS